MKPEFIHEQRQGYVYIKVLDQGKHVANVWKVFSLFLIEIKVGRRRKIVTNNLKTLFTKLNLNQGVDYGRN